MLRTIKISSLFILAYFFISCGSSKKELDIEEETPESLLLKSNDALDSGNYKEAISLDSLLLVTFPTSDLHIDAQLNTAKALGGLEKFEDQLDLILRILKENIIPEKVPLIYSQIAEFYEGAAVWNPGTTTSDSMDWLEAAKYYRKAVFYPDSDDNLTKAKSLYRAALMYAKLRQIDVARRAYEQTIAFYPDTKYSEMAKIKLKDPTNTSEIVLEQEALEGISGEGTILQESETPILQPEQTQEEVGARDIQEMITSDTTSTEVKPVTEMAPELYKPVTQDTLNVEPESIEPAANDTTIQEIE